MRRLRFIAVLLFLGFAGLSYAQDANELLLDDFEGEIADGEQGTVDYGSGNGSTVEVKASSEIKQHGAQALAVTFDAVSGGYIWIARGYDLTVKGAGSWLVEPKDIDFSKYNAIAFYMSGADINSQVAMDLVDNGGEYWRYLIEDNVTGWNTGWKEVVIPFKYFFCRGDWQPDKADKNGELNFPLKAFQFEPKSEGKGTLYFDYVRLVKKE